MKKLLMVIVDLLATAGWATLLAFWFMPVSCEHFMLCASGWLERFV